MLGVLITVGLVLAATSLGAVRVGPVVMMTLDRSTTPTGSTVALRPGPGLLMLWGLIVAAAVIRRG